MTRPAVGDDFRVLVDWDGPEDKPFYRALLLSASRASEASEEPFWGSAVISRQELDGLVDGLEKSGREFQPGSHTGRGSEYYVEIYSGSRSWHVSLGFDATTLTGLNAMAEALDPSHRKPLLDIVARIRRELGDGPAPQ